MIYPAVSKPKKLSGSKAAMPATPVSKSVGTSAIGVEYAKSGKSKCSANYCSDKSIEKDSLRAIVAKKCYHVECLSEDQICSTLASKVTGFNDLEDKDKDVVKKIFELAHRKVLPGSPPLSDDDELVWPVKNDSKAKTKVKSATSVARANRAKSSSKV